MIEEAGVAQPSDPKRAEDVRQFCKEFEEVLANVGKIIKGKDEVVRKVLLAMTARGHILLKDVPGTGKTMLARSISATIQMAFSRIQFTPDLLPMDITGTNVFNLRSKSFEFQAGPVFCNLLLADEINRATPKTQSALLEVMAEGQVTVEGKTAPFSTLIAAQVDAVALMAYRDEAADILELSAGELATGPVWIGVETAPPDESEVVSFYEEGLPITMNPLFAESMVDRRSHELVFDRAVQPVEGE